MKQNGPRLARSIPAKAGTSPITDRPIQKPCNSPFSGCQEAANKADHEREAGLDPVREGKPRVSVKEPPTGAQAVGPKLNKLRPDRLSRFDHPRDSGLDIHEVQPWVNRCCC